MPNKIYSDVANYLVEGAKDSGYLKKGKGSFGDGSTNTKSVDWNEARSTDLGNWFQGKQGSKGKGEAS